MPNPPAPDPRPKLARWLFERTLTYRDAAEPLGTSHETVRRICLPFSDPRRRVPEKDLMGRIQIWTRGEIGPADFYEPMAIAS